MNRGKLIIDLDANTKGFDYQIEAAQEKLNDLLATYEMLSKEEGFNEQSNEARNLRKEIEQASNAVVSLQKQQAKAQAQSQKAWNLDLKSIKKVALGIIGIRSLYSLARKASSSYLSSDIELAEKLQSVWVGLGSFLAPILEKFSDLMLKAVGYLNVFVKALTGIDFIANANAKALNKQAKAQANLNKQTQQYDFDVIRTQQEQTSGGGIDTGTSGLINIPELDEKLVNKLEKLALWLKTNEKWIKKVGVALGVTFGAAAMLKLARNIASLIGIGGTGAAAGTGLAGLATTLLFLADVFVITLVAYGVKETIENYKELNELVKNNATLTEDNTTSTKKVIDAFWDRVEAGTADNKIIDDHIGYLEKEKNSIIDQMKYETDQIKLYGQYSKVGKEHKKTLESLQKRYQYVTDDLKKMGDEGLNSKYKFSELDETLRDLTQDPWNINVILSMTEQYTGSSGFAHSSAGRHFATGGIVTQPTRALIGEAGYPEAVVPMNADYLSTLASEIAKYGNNNGSVTVNVSLDGKLIQRQMAKVEDKKRFATNG